MKNFNAFFKEFPLLLMGHIALWHVRSSFFLLLYCYRGAQWLTLLHAFLHWSSVYQTASLDKRKQLQFCMCKRNYSRFAIVTLQFIFSVARGGRFSFFFEKIISLWMIIPIYQCAIITQLFNNILLSHSWAAECRRY